MTDTTDSPADIASVPPALSATWPGEHAAEQELTALTAPLWLRTALIRTAPARWPAVRP